MYVYIYIHHTHTHKLSGAMLAEAMDSMAIETLQAHICISAGSCVYIYIYMYIMYIYT